MFLSERLKKIIDYRYPRRGAFTQLDKDTGISRANWNNIYNGRYKPGPDALEAICKLFPEYTLWLMTGQTNEEGGQTSPDIDQLKELQASIKGKSKTAA